MMWEQQVKVENTYEHQEQQNQYMQEVNNSPTKMDNMHNNIQADKSFSQADKVNLNTRIKTMILNKQQENIKMEESKAVEQNSTGHFLSYSHHHHLKKPLGDDGGFQNRYDSKRHLNLPQQTLINAHNNPLDLRRFAQIKNENYEVTDKHRMFTNNLNDINSNFPNPYADKNKDYSLDQASSHKYVGPIKQRNISDKTRQATTKGKRISTPLKPKAVQSPDKYNKQIGMEIPECQCLLTDQAYPEPGTYYTHLGCANNLKSLRHDLECRTGVTGVSIRIEKLRYTGKEGKTSQGCPIAKWVCTFCNKFVFI